ncbi:glutamyl-tRNA(Gln) amidotransferase subunit C, chloroplastic/mitochondrial [Mercurialis annua]|uniref:glutamyl-tRNA(Gln) amidotransferase subunit C, chloroplastic/mitochondrial n=1 Tax=Mercurialis annua TaxID=3986 RepID=UPI00215E3B85|nr:glutamyl-tRNA(Gln) amidotransferase subunit C, chloroplastic/mitochondrial [Mercurialis annua]
MGSRCLSAVRIASPVKHQIGRLSIKAAANGSSLEPPDVPRLAQTARISLNPHQLQEFAPKIRQVVHWFGQLQAVDLNSVEAALRADTEGENLRDDVPESFKEREAIIGALPSYEDPYVKVPKVLNRD